jgi:glycosyltransferase involved in cell wall biosynthesis
VAEKKRMKLSIIIPVYNEESTVSAVLKKVKEVTAGSGFDRELIVVDDGSTDGTPQLLDREKEDPAVTVHKSLINLGKGAAIRIGLEYVRGDIVIIQDADLELNPEEYPLLVKPIIDGKYDVVYGSRFRGTNTNSVNASFAANKFLTFLTNLLYGAKLTDMEVGYKVFRAGVIRGIKLKCFRFEFEPEITAKILRLGHAICEVPISYRMRTRTQGKKINWKDGVKAVYFLMKYRFTPIASIKKQPAL